MQKPTADTDQDALIQAYITRASGAVTRWCDREFVDSGAGATRTFEIPWDSDFLSLAPYDAQTITTVEIDTDQASPVTVPAAEWRAYPNPARDGVYTAVRLRPLGVALGRVLYPTRQVEITGTWGFPAVPDEVLQATAVTVVTWVTQNTAAYRTIDGEVVEMTKRGLPPEAMMLLQPYRRMEFA